MGVGNDFKGKVVNLELDTEPEVLVRCPGGAVCGEVWARVTSIMVATEAT